MKDSSTLCRAQLVLVKMFPLSSKSLDYSFFYLLHGSRDLKASAVFYTLMITYMNATIVFAIGLFDRRFWQARPGSKLRDRSYGPMDNMKTAFQAIHDGVGSTWSPRIWRKISGLL